MIHNNSTPSLKKNNNIAMTIININKFIVSYSKQAKTHTITMYTDCPLCSSLNIFRNKKNKLHTYSLKSDLLISEYINFNSKFKKNLFNFKCCWCNSKLLLMILDFDITTLFLHFWYDKLKKEIILFVLLTFSLPFVSSISATSLLVYNLSIIKPPASQTGYISSLF